MTDIPLTVSPKGSWRRNRFEFCNALEAALDTDDAEAWRLLEQMGVKRVVKSPEALGLQAKSEYHGT